MTGRLLLGYACVSTDAQDLAGQRDELHAVGCTRIFAEKITGTHSDRPELTRRLDHLRPGDVVTVTLDRLARNTAPCRTLPSVSRRRARVCAAWPSGEPTPRRQPAAWC
jgi:DNA invertase Pin-like site-specific DNA recombinase